MTSEDGRSKAERLGVSVDVSRCSVSFAEGKCGGCNRLMNTVITTALGYTDMPLEHQEALSEWSQPIAEADLDAEFPVDMLQPDQSRHTLTCGDRRIVAVATALEVLDSKEALPDDL